MRKFRAIFAVVLAFALVVLVSLGSVAEAKRPTQPLTYTSEQIAQLQTYASDLSAIRDRLPELADLIQKQDWVFVGNFIHGPLGEIRTKMNFLAQNLLPADQKQARSIAKLVASNLIAIDQAAKDKNYKAAIRNYAETIRDLDDLLQLVPKG
ncbi:photosystem II protein PsbQ [Kovacikia minuta CCNUW1]|uniref:photosystem II protein PsbQ n=1 Tax=Kovacikia minuta TaxID=2931930 RepID=UPI001CC90BC0|nr:photosystem II protein PsbQ [Kovacikia minuta]UBF24231.1 photosystem II protein PsbQ [Kovacikia minuta CCNUW1]